MKSTHRSLIAHDSPLQPTDFVTGLPGAAKAHWVLSQFSSSTDSLVVLCASESEAEQLSSDLVSLKNATGSERRIIFLPALGADSYRAARLSLKTRFDRLRALSELNAAQGQNTKTGTVLCTTALALAQSTIPPELFRRLSFSFKPGQVVERTDLLKKLTEGGYLRVDSVTDPGTFALRGEILDLFPPGLDQPVRLEWFDTDLERMRSFDPESQRIEEGSIPLSSLLVEPCREVVLLEEVAKRLRESLKTMSDDLGISRSLRDPVLETLQNRYYHPLSEGWAALAYPEPATGIDYLGESTQFIWDGFERVDGVSKTELENYATSWAASLPTFIPSPERVFTLSALTTPTGLRLAPTLSLEVFEKHSGKQQTRAAPYRTLPSLRHETSTDRPWESLSHFLEEQKKVGGVVRFFLPSRTQVEKLQFILSTHPTLKDSTLDIEPSHLSSGFIVSGGGHTPSTAYISERDMFGGSLSGVTSTPSGGGSPTTKKAARARQSAIKDWGDLHSLDDLAVGDGVVHIDHGIGRYQGVTQLVHAGITSEYLALEYAGRDKLYLPVYRLNLIQKYAGSGDSVVLDKLGGQGFLKAKEKVKTAVQKLAIDLLDLYAHRAMKRGIVCSPVGPEYFDFESRFAFEETPDQQSAIDDVFRDLESGRIMDRLICGDVGYGKTEVAIRAAFRLVSEGKQVAVLVPTTLLAFQHEQSFKKRFSHLPVTIESLSRFRSAKEQKTVLARLREGKVDIVIGTHRLLSKDVEFKELGIVIVDEEHRFGVEHKERLKDLKKDTHVLTLSATPIPRTLYLSISGVRDISLINTAPTDRLPVKTLIAQYQPEPISHAVRTELSRAGQIFFLHNRVQSIERTASEIRQWVPEAKVRVAHGQMPEGELERIMRDFYEKKFDVLVCTTIIESGLDIPNANTILVDHAHQLGLSQLYQIRGRVGRAQTRAYAYLLIPDESTLTADARARLEIIQRYVDLGSGFQIASHDLELRGGGDLLGPQQSGHIASVGFDLYTQLLEEAIQELRQSSEREGSGQTAAQREKDAKDPEIKVPYSAFLPEAYISDVHARLSLYRRLSGAKTEVDLNALETELAERFGRLPDEAQNLLWLIRLKQVLKRYGIESLASGPERTTLTSSDPFRGEVPLSPDKILALLAKDPSAITLQSGSGSTGGNKLTIRLHHSSLSKLVLSLEEILKRLSESK